MSPDPPTLYEQLTPEEAAHIDAVCDRFERAWKDTQVGGLVPRLASYLGPGHGSAHEALFRELVALDQACRQRYGLTARREDDGEPGAGAGDPVPSATRPLHRARTDVPAGRPADWPTIPGLELVAVLGSGGMGVVYRARQAVLDRDVAIKFLRDAHRADSGQRERFLQEARAVARLRHPNLVQLYEFGEVPGAGGATSQPYLVLEYVSGGSLADLLRGLPQPPAEAARLVETLADAIHYAHQQGVIHRDLKPANILLSFSRETPASADRALAGVSRLNEAIPKVTDFGLAKFLAGGDLTQSGYVLGTPSYMAPEQAAGQSGLLTAAVDNYGLGTILYEALTGRPPFAAATFDTTLGLVRDDEPVPPRRLQPGVPRDLETICLKCLRKEPSRRYATAQGLADDLRRFRAGEPIRARPVGTGERVVGWCRRRPGVAGLLAALLLVFLAGLSGVLWQWQSANRNAARAERNAAQAERNAAAMLKERDAAQQEKERAERHLRWVRKRVELLNRLGRDLSERPGLYHAGKAALEEALALYEQLLREDDSDSQLRQEAAQVYREVGHIRLFLGKWGQAAEAFAQEGQLLSGLLSENPADTALRRRLASSHRWRGNVLRDLGRVREAREAYDQAADIHKQLLRESPQDPDCQVQLANTLLNTATLLPLRERSEERERLCARVVELLRAAVAARDEPGYQLELALGLQLQGRSLLAAGQGSPAEAAVREALEIRKKVLAGARRKGGVEPYLARNYADLGTVLAASGRAPEADQTYQKALNLLDRLMKESPESAYHRADLAETLAGRADLLARSGRKGEAEEVRRQVIGHYDILMRDFPEDPRNRINRVAGYLDLAGLLCELGRPDEADQPYRKALELDPEDPDANNERAWFLATTPEPRLRNAVLAMRLAKKAVEARPQSANFRNTLGVAHYRNGDERAAVAELETAVGLRAGEDCSDGFFLAMAHWRLGDRDKARTWFDRAVQGMDRHRPDDDELRRFRAEAEALLTEAGKR
jgi:tetratricopeptide (TPR) repeat protein